MKHALAALALCSSLAHADEQAYINAAVADTVTTYAAISSGMGAEANPLGFAGVTLAKVAVYHYAKTLPEDEKEQVLHTTTAAMTGASVNNALIFLGAASGVSIVAGLITFLVMLNG